MRPAPIRRSLPLGGCCSCEGVNEETRKTELTLPALGTLSVGHDDRLKRAPVTVSAKKREESVLDVNQSANLYLSLPSGFSAARGARRERRGQGRARLTRIPSRQPACCSSGARAPARRAVVVESCLRAAARVRRAAVVVCGWKRRPEEPARGRRAMGRRREGWNMARAVVG